MAVLQLYAYYSVTRMAPGATTASMMLWAKHLSPSLGRRKNFSPNSINFKFYSFK